MAHRNRAARSPGSLTPSRRRSSRAQRLAALVAIRGARSAARSRGPRAMRVAVWALKISAAQGRQRHERWRCAGRNMQRSAACSGPTRTLGCVRRTAALRATLSCPGDVLPPGRGSWGSVATGNSLGRGRSGRYKSPRAGIWLVRTIAGQPWNMVRRTSGTPPRVRPMPRLGRSPPAGPAENTCPSLRPGRGSLP